MQTSPGVVVSCRAKRPVRVSGIVDRWETVDQQGKGITVPLLDLFWTILLIFLWVAWIWVVISVVMDIFRNHESSGFTKALWVLVVILIPWLGVLAYLIVNGDDMSRRNIEMAQRNDAAAQAYIRQAAGSTSAADQLEKLSNLRAQGVISDSEFAAQKAKLLA